MVALGAPGYPRLHPAARCGVDRRALGTGHLPRHAV